MTPSNAEVLRYVRVSHGLSATQAGRLVGVTKRAWEHWESGARQVPQSSFELFMAKCQGVIPPQMNPETDLGLFVVINSSGQPLIVLGRGSWIDVEVVNGGRAIVTSFVVDFRSGRREKVETLVDLESNPRLLETLARWRTLDKDLGSR
ncbi:hypothetical protein ALO82_200302 [Pseudomonas syringae pv. broussonetiae]|nr:hypothetical protein ALO82_200302 [Pseudomonas syringae pv. broussonetiae]KWS99870.1 hypothetical protein AL047_06380 [Pseudomonas syringae pv. broussonetiae]